MLWLQTPARDADAGERARLVLANGAGGGDATRFEDFESYEAYVRHEGESAECASGSSSAGCVSDTWRGCDAQRHLLDALARRSATIAATGGGGGGGGEPAAGRGARRVDARDPRRRRLRGRRRSALRGPGGRDRRPARGAAGLSAGPLARARPGNHRRAPAVRARRRAPELAAALTWHLGENVNFACGEYAWTAEARCTASARVRAGTDTKRLGVGVGDDTGSECFSAEKEGGEGAAATAAGRAPALAAAVASLARAALTSRCWMTRAAAVSALATVALRSGEPFRLQCYTALREARSASTSSSHASSGGGQRGFDACASALERHVATLDHVYRGGARFRARCSRGTALTRRVGPRRPWRRWRAGTTCSSSSLPLRASCLWLRTRRWGGTRGRSRTPSRAIALRRRGRRRS